MVKKMSLTIKKKIIISVFLFFLSSIAALYLVSYLVKVDFMKYREGEKEDIVYVLASFFETKYEKTGGFEKGDFSDGALLALSLGYEIVVYDKKGNIVTSTVEAIRNIKPLARRRHLTHIGRYEEFIKEKNREDFEVYELFLKSEEIGTLYLRRFEEKKGLFFIERTTQFMVVGIIAAFIASVFLGLFITSKILTPLSRLHRAASDIAKGRKIESVEIKTDDEIGELAAIFNVMAKSLNEREAVRKSSMSKFAHELRTPIAVMQAEIEAMIDGVLPVGTERLKSINEELQRLKKMVEGLERLYKLEKDTAFLDIKEISMPSFLDGIKDKFMFKANERKDTIIIKTEEFSVFTAPLLLTTVIYNLVDNALNATENGTITLLARSEKEGFVIEVKDTGKGIEESELPFIFERFYTKRSEGLGIGLALVKEITDILDGEIMVSSVVGKGTTFTLRFKNLNRA